MKRALTIFAAVCLLAGASFGACAAKTTVADTLYNSTQTPLTGTVYVTNAMVITDSGGCVVAANTRVSAAVVNGAFSIALVPNNGSSPTGTSYTAEFHVSSGIYRETWVVPASGPVALTGVRALTPPIPTSLIAFSQITPPSPCFNNQVPTWNGVTLSWFCATPSAGGITSLNALGGASQTFATDALGSDFGIGSSGTVHTFSLPTASATKRGALSSSDWSIFNGKQAAIAGNNLPANNFGTGISAAGALLGAQPAFSNLSGSPTAAQLGSGSATSSTLLHGDLTWGALVSGDIPNNTANTTGSARSLLGGASALSQIFEEASDIWSIRNGTTAEQLNVYKTFTSGSAYTAIQILGNSGTTSGPGIRAVNVGGVAPTLELQTGGSKDMYFTDGTIRWLIKGTTSALQTQNDNSYDFGATGANRPRSGYFATDVNIESASNGAQWKHAYATELLTLSTVGATSDTVGNLLPANSIIEAVEVRITTTITTATNWSVGDATTAARFCAANSTLTAGTTSTCTVHVDQTGAAGPRQTAAAKVRITTTGTPGAGVIRITVFYRIFTPPTS